MNPHHGESIAWPNVLLNCTETEFQTKYLNSISVLGRKLPPMNFKPYLLYFTLLVTSQTNAQNLNWAGHLESQTFSSGFSVDTDNLGNVYSVGIFGADVDADPGVDTIELNSTGNSDLYISKLNVQGDYIWGKSIGGTDDIAGSCVQVDDNLNVLVTGGFSGTVDFDPGPGVFNLTASGTDDMFYLKLNPSGDFLWAKRIGGIHVDKSISMTTNSMGEIYSTGQFRGTVDFNPGPGVYNLSSSATGSVFVNKLDSSGNFVWAKHFNGTGYDEAHGITLDASGNIYTSGFFDETVDFDPGIGVFNMTALSLDFDVFISKLSPSGDFIWAKQIGGNKLNDCFSIRADQQGNIYLGGYYYGTTDFDPGPSVFTLSTGGGFSPPSNAFVCKLDTSGSFQWAKQIEGASGSYIYDLSLDSEDNVVAVGTFEGTCDADPGAGTINLSSSGGEDILMFKLNPSGAILWANGFGDTDSDISYGVNIGPDNEVFVTGWFHGTIDFDPGMGINNLTAPTGVTNAYICRYDDDYTNSIIETENQPNTVLSYPNPTKDYLRIDADNIQNVEVYNSLGHLVKVFPSGTTDYYIGDLAQGAYTLVVQTNQGRLNSRIMKLD